MIAALHPSSLDELAALVRGTPSLLPVGAGTKPRLARSPPGCIPLFLDRLAGIVEYEPAEFTVTARAGTRLDELDAELATQGQYLPFDPPLAESGATLGGTVAAGLSGPGRLRHGGVRDFVLGVRFVDGSGRLLRAGGKVVKNAAGFDLPKFLVGSAGRFGVLGEVTVKVFPRPVATRTVRIICPDFAALMATLADLAGGPWELDALEASPAESTLLARVAGPASAMDDQVRAIRSRWGGYPLSEVDAVATWADLAEFRWTHRDGALLKIPVTLAQVAPLWDLLGRHPDFRLWLGGGASVAWLSVAEALVSQSLYRDLQVLGLSGVTLRGDGPMWPGGGPLPAVAATVKQALDPANRFPPLAD